MKIIADFRHKAECFYNNSELKSVLRVVVTDGSSANVYYRIAQFFKNLKLNLIGFIFLEINKFFNGCVIGRNTEFDEGLILMHPIGVVINGGVKGGKNIIIESNVVIGAARNGLPVEVPVLGNNIFIGSGAKVLGKIKVGNNVKIGANSVILKDVPDGATVVGIPGRVVSIEKESKKKKWKR